MCEVKAPSIPVPGFSVRIRVMAGVSIGMGHVARSVSLARALESIGAQVDWACGYETARFLYERGVSAERVTRFVNDAIVSHEALLDDKAQLRDAEACLSGNSVDWVVVDSYAFGSTWHRAIRDRSTRVLAFDDLLDRPLDVDIVVNAATSADAYLQLAPGAKAICGLRYAVTGHAPRRGGDDQGDVSIAFGANDPFDMTGRVLDAVMRSPSDLLRGLRTLSIRLGPHAPHRNGVESRLRAIPRARFAQPEDRNSVLVIGAAGVSLLERMQDGEPSILLCASSNQRRLLEAAVRAGAAVEAADADDAVRIASELIEDPGRRTSMSAAGRSAVDGMGAQRIARVMNRAIGVRLRRAESSDAERLHRWRNDPAVRLASLSGDPIPWSMHLEWFRDCLRRSDRTLLIAERAGHPVGTLRFDAQQAVATISITVDPSLAGAGFGPAMLDAGFGWIRREMPEIALLRAEIRPDNAASRAAFESAGFRMAAAIEDRLEYHAMVRRQESSPS